MYYSIMFILFIIFKNLEIINSLNLHLQSTIYLSVQFFKKHLPEKENLKQHDNFISVGKVTYKTKCTCLEFCYCYYVIEMEVK